MNLVKKIYIKIESKEPSFIPLNFIKCIIKYEKYITEYQNMVLDGLLLLVIYLESVQL